MVQNPPASAGDMSLNPGLGRSPGAGKGNPFQYSCQGDPIDRSLEGYSPRGPNRVRHDLGTKTATYRAQNIAVFPHREFPLGNIVAE